MTNNVENSSGDAVATIKAQPSKEKNVSHMHFYQNERLFTKLSAQSNLQVFRMQDVALAQLEQNQAPKVLLTDGAKSVIGMPQNSMTYSPYGYLHAIHSNALLAYNGYWYDPITHGYLLGNGYRLFSPHLMRFCCQDSMSPFDKGGLNAYAYCMGDPVNNTDANGHFRIPFLKRSPESSLIHYNTKIQKLTARKIKTEGKVLHYETKIKDIARERHNWLVAAKGNNSSDRNGNTPSEYAASLKHDLTRNKAKLHKQENKLAELKTDIQRNQLKLLDSQHLLFPQAPIINNEPPEHTTPSEKQTQTRNAV